MICAAAVLLMLAALSACAILPTEDTPLAAPVLRDYERRQPTLVAVRRDDLVRTKTISCRSRPVREQSYSFEVGGIYIDRIYVSVGDSVKAGDLLAELDRKDILNQVDEGRIAVRKQEFALELAMDDTSLQRDAYIISLMQKEIDKLVLARKDVPPEQAAELDAAKARYEKAHEDYLFNVAYAEQMLEIAERKLETLLEIAEERVIYTTIDGVVSYVQRFLPGARSVADERVFTISDSSELLYTVTGEDALFFTPGEVYSMRVSKSFHDMRAVSREDIGDEESGMPVMYFIPEDLSSGLATYGYITVETERRDSALFLPSAAIIQVGDNFVVYRTGEHGFRELAYIEVGVTISGKTEILSGLVEGDEVIIG